jgi:hypothetical protein
MTSSGLRVYLRQGVNGHRTRDDPTPSRPASPGHSRETTIYWQFAAPRDYRFSTRKTRAPTGMAYARNLFAMNLAGPEFRALDLRLD